MNCKVYGLNGFFFKINDGLRNGKKKIKIKISDALERKIFAIYENDMHRNGNLC